MKPLNKSKYLQDFISNQALKGISIIDVHTHMDDIYEASTPIHQIDECVDYMKEKNIDSIWCCPHSDLFSVDGINENVERYMAKYPDKVKGYFGFNPNYYEEYAKNMHKILEIDSYIGFKFLPVYHNAAFSDERYRPALELADKHNLVVLSHTWGNTGCSPSHVADILKTYKNFTFIFGHSAPNELDGAIELVKKHDNAYLDLCDIHRHSGIVEKMVNAVGAEHVLFGTDFPWYDFDYCTGSILCAHITDDQREMIFNKNAKNILRRIKK